MSAAASIPGLSHEFDDFLFAPIGEESNGMLLSVVSAMARSNVDPWREAAQLAQLPANAATRKLTLLIAALPGTRFDAGAIAARLVALLPRPGVATAAVPEQLFAGTASRILGNRSAVTFAIVWALLLGVQAIAASHQPPRAAPPAASASATSGNHTTAPTSGE